MYIWKHLDGLKNLINTYKAIINHTLIHYKTIEQHLKNNSFENQYEDNINTEYNSDDNNDDNSDDNIDDNSDGKSDDNEIIKFIIKLWKEDELNIIYNIFIFINKLDINKDKGKIDMYCDILENYSWKRNYITYYIENITSSY